MRTSLIAAILFLSFSASAQQIAENVFWIYFTDKADNGYSIGQPGEFLSERSVNRRAWQGLDVDQTDLPVSRAYVDSLLETGADIRHTSRWLNGVAIVDSTGDIYRRVLDFSFTDTLPWMPVTDDIFFPPSPAGKRFDPPMSPAPSFDYGSAENQIEMIDTDYLHSIGYTGKGVWMGILDVGFRNVDSLPSFESMVSEGRILGTRNFVYEEDVYRVKATHGTRVLSIAGGEYSGEMMGTGPHASYYLCITEDDYQETRMEEISWISAAEYLDSLGIDIINTSLGYHNFDSTLFDYRYSDMDGRSSFISRASSMAADKGIICCNSAGNQGNKFWYYITPPADASDVITVGAVTPSKNIAYFSSRGPTYDSRIKPDIVALGQSCMGQAQSGQITAGNGTSFSNPLISGSVASLWQAYPELPAKEMIHFIRQSGDRKWNPDATFGYGIPSFHKAFWKVTSVPAGAVAGQMEIYPNPASDRIMIKPAGFIPGICILNYLDINGRLVASQQVFLPGEVILPGQLGAGIYILELRTSKAIYHQRLLVK